MPRPSQAKARARDVWCHGGGRVVVLPQSFGNYRNNGAILSRARPLLASAAGLTQGECDRVTRGPVIRWPTEDMTRHREQQRAPLQSAWRNPRWAVQISSRRTRLQKWRRDLGRTAALPLPWRYTTSTRLPPPGRAVRGAPRPTVPRRVQRPVGAAVASIARAMPCHARPPRWILPRDIRNAHTPRWASRILPA
jgi:hypothetical protein